MNRVSRDLSGETRCTTIIRSGELLATVTPMLRTSAGSRGCATLRRFCTCTCAMSRLVPRSKVTAMVKRPSAVAFEDRYSMFSTPLICSSIGATTVEATTSALAPGYWPVTLMIGGAISGYCAIGSRAKATAPRMTKTIETTEAKIGRSMKKCEKRIRRRPYWVQRDREITDPTGSWLLLSRGLGRGRGRTLLLRVHLHPGPRPHQAVDDEAIVGGQPVLDHALTVDQLAQRHITLARDTLAVDHEHIFARLFAQDGAIRHQQRRIGGRTRHAHAREHAGREY